MRLLAILLIISTEFLISTVIEGRQGFKVSGTTKQKQKQGNSKNNDNRSFFFQSESKRSQLNQKTNQRRMPIRDTKPDREPFKDEDKGNFNINSDKKIHLNDLSSKELGKLEFNPLRRPQQLFKNVFGQQIEKVKWAECSLRPKEVFVSERKSYAIQSPGYPRFYTKNQNCGWFFTADEGVNKLKLECETFWLRKPRRNKCQDYLLLSDGYEITGHCGQDSPTGLSTLTGYLDAWFVSGRRKNLEYTGFSCKISAERIPTSTAQLGKPNPPVVDNSCRCGRINTPTKIVGGQESKVNEYPWMVAIVKKSTSEVFCGAAIINSRWIITAAHCTDYINFSNVAYQVLVGAHSTADSADAEIRLEPIRIVEHPDYDYAKVINDISLIEIPSLIFKSPAVAPICLPDPGNLYEAMDATVTGWGSLNFGGKQPEVLMEVTVTTVTNHLCEKSYPGEIINSMLCAGGKGGKDACQGDSGGPLIASAGNHHVIIGIVSWGRGCAMAGYPGVYTRVTEYLNWIDEVINNMDEEVTVCALE